MANNSKRRGFNPVVAFLLGFLLGIIVLIGAVAAAVMIALNYKLDNIDANKNEDGSYIIVNADPDNGGAENVLDLVSKITELAGEEELSLGKISTLFPIADSLAGGLIDSFGQYVDLTYDEFKTVAFSEIGTFLQDKVMDIRPAALLDLFGGGSLTEGSFGEIVDILLNGSEAKYVYNDGERYPVYYDTYKLSGAHYEREDGTNLHSRHESYLTEKGSGYRLYFFKVGGVYYVTERGSDGSFIYTTDRYDNYDGNASTLTGTYYLDNDGERVGDYVTIRSFADGSAFGGLNELYITDLLSGSGLNDITNKLLGDITLGDLLSGADFESIINNLEISAFVDIDPTNNIMMYLAYGITGVFNDGSGNYSGSYALSDGTSVTCILETQPAGSGLKVTGAYYFNEDGAKTEVPPTVVSNMNDRLKNVTYELALSDLIPVAAPTHDNKNAVMIFLAYSVTDAVAVDGEEYSFTGKYHPADGGDVLDCYIVCKNGDISDIYYLDGGERKSIEKTCIANVSKQINRLTKTLRLKDVINVGEDKVMVKLGEFTLDNVKDAIDVLTLDDFIDVTVKGDKPETSEVVLSYVVYGVTRIDSGAGVIEGKSYTHTGVYSEIGGEKHDCYLVVEAGLVTEVFYVDGDEIIPIAGTTVKTVSKRVAGVTEDLTIGELMNVNGNKILEAISDSTIKNLPTDIGNLAINELYADSIYAPSASQDGATQDGYVAKKYLAVPVSELKEAQTFHEDWIYYVEDSDGNLVLASTTGKLSGFDKDTKYYACGEGRIVFNTDYLYYTAGENLKYKLVNNNGRVQAQEFKENTYYTYGAPNAMWKLLIYKSEKNEATGVTVKYEEAYSVNNLTKMITNVTANTQHTTMRELHEAGIMKFEDERDLNTKITYKGEATTIGALSLEEFVSFFVSVARDPSILIPSPSFGS